MSILSGSATGAAVYTETHTGKPANAYGLVELEIGKGTPVTGTFAGISWGANDYFLKVEMDPNGGSAWQAMGTSQLLSVPYALYARDVENNADGDADHMNEIQVMSLSGTVLSLSKGGGTVTLPSSGGGDNWGTQAVMTDATLAGNGTPATPLKIAQQSATAGQVLKWDGTTWKPAADATGSGGSTPTGPAGGDLSGTYPDPLIGTGKVTSAKILDGSVANADLADNAVTTLKIADGAIATPDLANSTVTTDKLGNLSVSAEKILNGAVTADKLATNAVTVAKLPAGATADTYLRGDGTWAVPSGSGGGLTLPYAGSFTTSGTTFFVANTSATNGAVAIGGKSTATTGEVRGIFGESLSVSGSGVYGKSPKYGVFGEAVRTTGMASIYGVFGKTDDSQGSGVYGQGLNTGIYGASSSETGPTYGVIGTTSSPEGTGVSGTSAYRGVYGNASGYKGRAIVGEATGTNSIGMFGAATNDNSTGVWGEGSNQGVYGKSDLATGKGVFGQVTSATGYSGYFDGGKFYVSGNVGIGTTSPAKKLHVNGSAQVKDTLYANVVNASKVTIMPGIANSIVNSLFSVPSSWGVMNSVTLNVPATGYVLLIASGEFQSVHDVGDNTHFYMGASKKSDGTDVKQIASWLVFSDRPTSVIHEVISAQAVLQVTSAGSQTFYLMGYRESGADTDEVLRIQCNLTAVYFPVAYGTVE